MANFTIVEFLTEHTIEVVPSKWLVSDDQCWWPSLKGPKLQKFLTNKYSQPDMADGILFKAKVIKSYESYSEARKHLEKAEDTSSLETPSESELTKSRKDRKRKILEDYATPRVERRHQKRSEVDDSPLFSDSDSGDSLSIINVPNPPSMSENAPVMTGGDFVGNDLDILQEVNKLKQESRNFQDAVLKYFIKIKADIDEVKKMLISLQGCPNIAGDLPSLPPFPLENIDGLENVERWLTNIENVQILTRHYTTIGGDSIKDTTKRILSRTFSNDVASLINWTGKNKKFPLKNCVISKVIIDAVRLTHSSALTTEKSVEEQIKSWFRFAKDREGGRERRRVVNIIPNSFE